MCKSNNYTYFTQLQISTFISQSCTILLIGLQINSIHKWILIM